MKLSNIGAKNDMPYGWLSKTLVNRKIYNMWSSMLGRCYCDNRSNKYQWYKDCTVHPDFLLLSNFVKWIEKEPNYPLLVDEPIAYKWTIDKDGIVPGNKEYAPGKIRLVTNKENVSEQLSRNGNPMKNNPYCQSKAIIGINIVNGNVLYFKSTRDADKEGFNHSTLVGSIKGRQKTHRNYKWFYATDLLGVMNYLYKG